MVLHVEPSFFTAFFILDGFALVSLGHYAVVATHARARAGERACARARAPTNTLRYTRSYLMFPLFP